MKLVSSISIGILGSESKVAVVREHVAGNIYHNEEGLVLLTFKLFPFGFFLISNFRHL